MWNVHSYSRESLLRKGIDSETWPSRSFAMSIRGLYESQSFACKESCSGKRVGICEFSYLFSRTWHMSIFLLANCASRIKDMVMQEALQLGLSFWQAVGLWAWCLALLLRKEQKSFGKFDKLKSYAEDIQSKWDAQMVKQYLLLGSELSRLHSEWHNLLFS